MMRRFLSLALIFGSFTPLSGCMGGTEERIVQSLPSPNGRVTAFRMNREAGATVSDSVFLFLVPTGETVHPYTTPVVKLNKYRNVDMMWRGDNELIVTYELASVIDAEKIWSSPQVDSNRYTVKVTLQKKP